MRIGFPLHTCITAACLYLIILLGVPDTLCGEEEYNRLSYTTSRNTPLALTLGFSAFQDTQVSGLPLCVDTEIGIEYEPVERFSISFALPVRAVMGNPGTPQSSMTPAILDPSVSLGWEIPAERLRLRLETAYSLPAGISHPLAAEWTGRSGGSGCHAFSVSLCLSRIIDPVVLQFHAGGSLRIPAYAGQYAPIANGSVSVGFSYMEALNGRFMTRSSASVDLLLTDGGAELTGLISVSALIVDSNRSVSCDGTFSFSGIGVWFFPAVRFRTRLGRTRPEGGNAANDHPPEQEMVPGRGAG
jgi:hypothetical protein